MINRLIDTFYLRILRKFKGHYLTAIVLMGRLLIILAAIGAYFYGQLNQNPNPSPTLNTAIIVALVLGLTIESVLATRYTRRLIVYLTPYLAGQSDDNLFYENAWNELLGFPEKLAIFEAKMILLLVGLPPALIIMIQSRFASGAIITASMAMLIGLAVVIIALWFFYERATLPLIRKLVGEKPELLNIPVEPTRMGLRKRLTLVFTLLSVTPILVLAAFFHQTIHELMMQADVQLAEPVIRSFINNATVVTLLTFVVVIFFAQLLASSISRPINIMLPQIDKITQGDLRESITVITRNEAGQLAISFNQLMQSIRFLVDEMQNASAMIISSSFHVLSVAQQQREDAANLSTSVSEIQVTAEQLAHSFKRIISRASAGQQLANNTLNQAQKGQELIDRNADAFRKIREQSRISIDKTQHFVTQSNQITQIFETIQTIVAQTKMIALNASIEAAGSGTTGHRFSVIAAEIRKLADKSTELLSEISRTVRVLQDSTLDMADSIEQEIQTVEYGYQHAERIQEVFKEILNMTESNARSVHEISGVASQQNIAHEQIVNGIRQISDVATKIEQSSHKLNELTVQMDELARQLSLSTKQFQTS